MDGLSPDVDDSTLADEDEPPEPDDIQPVVLEESAPEEDAAAPKESEVPSPATKVAESVASSTVGETHAEKTQEIYKPIIDDDKSKSDNVIDNKSGEPEKRKKKSQSTGEETEMFLLPLVRALLTCCIPFIRPPTASAPSSRRNSKIKSNFPEKIATGKLGPYKSVDSEITSAFSAVEEQIKEKIAELNGSPPAELEIVGYKVQQVVGLNLFAKIKIDGGPKYVHAKIFQSFNGDCRLYELSQLKMESDEIEYF